MQARIVWKVGIEAAYLSGGRGLLHRGDRHGEREETMLWNLGARAVRREGDRSGKLREASEVRA